MHSGVATCAGGALTGVVHAGTGTTSIVTPSAIERWASAVPPVPCQLATQVLILVALSLNECFFCFLKKFPSRPHAVVPFPWLHQAPLPWSCCQAPQAADALRLTQRTRVHHRGYQCCCCRLCTAGCVSVHVKLGPAL